MAWLVTGGAGYIGAHIIREILASNRDVVVFDDLSTGLQTRVPETVPLVHANITDPKAVSSVFEKYEIHGVLHLAARKQVGESVERPTFYWQENVIGFFNILTAMQQHGVKNLVFSSSAAVYGQPDKALDSLISELDECHPINPYGATKLAGEQLSQAFVHSDAFKVVALRYFNVAGAGDNSLGDPFALNLIPIVFEEITNNRRPLIFGNDYPTPDGTCVRDYIHVQDLAQGHLATMNFVEQADPIFTTINLGTGHGSSVSEVISEIQNVTGIDFQPEVVARRVGDPAKLVADPAKAKDLLNWQSQLTLTEMVESAWSAFQTK